MRSRTSTPPSGTYAEVAPFAKVMRSGVTPNRLLANASPVRPKPVITSSKTAGCRAGRRMSRTPGEIALGIHDDAVRSDDRLDQDRGDARRILVRQTSSRCSSARCRLRARIVACETDCGTGTARRNARRPACPARSASAGSLRSASRRPAPTVKRAVCRQHLCAAGHEARDLDRVLVRLAAARREERAAALRPWRQRRSSAANSARSSL